MKKITLLFLLLTVSSWAQAKTVYITDNIQVNLKAGDHSTSKVIATLPSGTSLTFISKQRNSEYTKVRMPGGRYAFILSRDTIDKPTGRVTLEKTTLERDKLKQENEVLENELLMLKGDSVAAKTSNTTLGSERDKLALELEELKYTSTHSMKLKEERDSFQVQAVQLQKELTQVKSENQTVKANNQLDWFLYGGTAITFSILLGFLLPKLSWRSKRTGGWN
ncbi:MAG: TIGR04211 family SH3 domain-containing protein [Methylococcales bacterium]|nr:TIGR04211 family SH3 domain-containing protein [Methylococcales bacterium]MCK5924587.1 TIGR04211 family SH3 domain-containing protein [Methylococcales bacterium]